MPVNTGKLCIVMMLGESTAVQIRDNPLEIKAVKKLSDQRET